MRNLTPLNAQPVTTGLDGGDRLTLLGGRLVAGWWQVVFWTIRVIYAGFRGGGDRYDRFFKNFAHMRKTPKTLYRQTMGQPATPVTHSTRGSGYVKATFHNREGAAA